MQGTLSLRKALWLLAGTGASIAATTAGPEYLITFGDSYSQTGFNPSLALPSAKNPLGNPNLPGYTASGGLNWVGFLTSVLNTTQTLTYNFAYGGATTSASLVTPYQPTVLSLIDQVKQFTTLFSTAAKKPWTAKNTLVGVWIGVNDVGNSWGQSNENARLASILDVYFAQLQTIYNAGARNFVLLSVPPIYLTPTWLSHSKSDIATIKAVISTYNSLLASQLTTFTKKNMDVTAKIIETNASFVEAINNPTKYGAPNAVCFNSDGKSCLWFNDYHPGIAINKLIAQAVATAWPSFF